MKRRYVFLLCFMTHIASASHAAFFVSLGLPDATLSQIFRQANNAHIPIVLRGLYPDPNHPQGDIKATMTRLLPLLKKQPTGMVINPLLFRAFGIQAVPALVVYDDHLRCIQGDDRHQSFHCSPNTFDVVLGNARLDDLLTTVIESSESANRRAFAKQRLQQLEDRV